MKSQEYEEIDIISILEIKDYNIVLLFENFEVRQIDFVSFLEHFPEDKKTNKQMLSANQWKTLKLDFGSLYFPNIMNGFSVAPDSLYKYSIPASIKPEYISKIRKIKGFSQKQLAKKMRIKQSELSLIETGKKSDLKILSKALSILL